MAMAARRQGIELAGLKVEVIKEMSAAPPRRIVRLGCEVWLPVAKSADPDGALEKAALGCPVALSLHPDIEKPVKFHWAAE